MSTMYTADTLATITKATQLHDEKIWEDKVEAFAEKHWNTLLMERAKAGYTGCELSTALLHAHADEVGNIASFTFAAKRLFKKRGVRIECHTTHWIIRWG